MVRTKNIIAFTTEDKLVLLKIYKTLKSLLAYFDKKESFVGSEQIRNAEKIDKRAKKLCELLLSPVLEKDKKLHAVAKWTANNLLFESPQSIDEFCERYKKTLPGLWYLYGAMLAHLDDPDN